MRALLTIVVLVLSTAGAPGQSSPSAAQSGGPTFRGLVVDAGTGSAVRRARITVISGRRPIGTVTADEEGRFRANVPGDALSVRIVKPGYASIVARVSPAQVRASDPVRFEVPRGAVITGRAVDDSGEPAMLVIVRRLTADGLSWSPLGPDDLVVDGDRTAIVNPDSRGEYRAAGLVAGRYAVEAYQPGRSMTLNAGRPGEAFTVTIDGASARPASVNVDVQAGEEATGVDLFVSRPPPPDDRAAEAGGATIRGMVSTTDGSPLADAMVTAARASSGPAGGPRTTTDVSGRFTLRGVPLGSVSVQASKRGYVQSQAGQRGGGLPGLPVRIEGGKDVDDISIVLPRSGVVSGLVLDEYGEPFQEASVQLLSVRRLPTGGLARQVGGALVRTDDRGQFRLWDVRPGDYVVMASVDDSGFSRTAELAEPTAAQRTVYVPAYHPDGADFGSAATIRIADGDEMPGVVLTMRRVPAARVSGIVHNSQGQPFRGTVGLTLRHGGADLRGSRRALSPQPGGEFDFADVPPGDYVVSAQSGPDLGGPEFGVANVTVVDRDPAPVVMRTSPGSRVSGRIVLEGSPGDVLWGYSATSVAIDAVSLPGSVSNQGPISTGESFTLDSLVGPTRLRVWSQDENWYLKSIVINGVDVADAPFDFGFDGRPYSDVEVVFSRGGATLTGRATNDRAAPLRDYAAYIFSTDRDRWFVNSRWVRLARATADGGFTASSMPPGEYWVVAVDRVDAPAADWLDTELLTTLSSRATRVTLGEGQSQAVSLRVLDR